MSYGTEGRRGNPADEIAPSSSVYEYIVFRGSDVKDISVADEEKKEKTQPEPPRVPDDPAILGVSLFCSPLAYSLPSRCIICLWLYPCGRSFDQMMKYFGCKFTDLIGMRKTVSIFPLPSF